MVVLERKWKGPLRMIQDAGNLLLSVKSLGVEPELDYWKALCQVTQSFACFATTYVCMEQLQIEQSTHLEHINPYWDLPFSNCCFLEAVRMERGRHGHLTALYVFNIKTHSQKLR